MLKLIVCVLVGACLIAGQTIEGTYYSTAYEEPDHIYYVCSETVGANSYLVTLNAFEQAFEIGTVEDGEFNANWMFCGYDGENLYGSEIGTVNASSNLDATFGLGENATSFPWGLSRLDDADPTPLCWNRDDTEITLESWAVDAIYDFEDEDGETLFIMTTCAGFAGTDEEYGPDFGGQVDFNGKTYWMTGHCPNLVVPTRACQFNLEADDGTTGAGNVYFGANLNANIWIGAPDNDLIDDATVHASSNSGQPVQGVPVGYCEDLYGSEEESASSHVAASVVVAAAALAVAL